MLKHFLECMLVILFTIGSSFALEVSASYFIFPLFGYYIRMIIIKSIKNTAQKNLFALKFLMESKTVLNLFLIVILFPAYIWIIFCCLHKKVPKLFTRLCIGITLYLLGVVSLLIAEVMGHTLNKNSFSNHSLCVFQVTISQDKLFTYPVLNMHWGVLIPPTLLLGLEPMLVITTTLEFISAQSPRAQSMKGLLAAWSLFCHQRSLSFPQFHCHHSLIPESAVGQ